MRMGHIPQRNKCFCAWKSPRFQRRKLCFWRKVLFSTQLIICWRKNSFFTPKTTIFIFRQKSTYSRPTPLFSRKVILFYPENHFFHANMDICTHKTTFSWTGILALGYLCQFNFFHFIFHFFRLPPIHIFSIFSQMFFLFFFHSLNTLGKKALPKYSGSLSIRWCLHFWVRTGGGDPPPPLRGEGSHKESIIDFFCSLRWMLVEFV